MTRTKNIPRIVRWAVMTCVVMLLGACSHSRAASSIQPAAAGYVTLDPSLKRLQNDFNADADKVRLLYIVGGTCPVCLRGMDDLGKALSAQQNDPHLQTFIVYVPALGAKATDIRPTVYLLPGKYVSRYWDPSGTSGRLFDETLHTGGFAWDVWMIYGAGQRWDGTKPPVPDFWMDQLGPPLPQWRYLDAGTFNKQVERYLARIRTAPASSLVDAP
ncbi:MAG: hypothetical protein WBR29_00505 [Gammaproteobacteria bacterium]